MGLLMDLDFPQYSEKMPCLRFHTNWNTVERSIKECVFLFSLLLWDTCTQFPDPTIVVSLLACLPPSFSELPTILIEKKKCYCYAMLRAFFSLVCGGVPQILRHIVNYLYWIHNENSFHFNDVVVMSFHFSLMNQIESC